MLDYIIVADDDEDDRLVIEEVLAEVRFPLPVYFTKNGYEVINHLEQSDNLLPKFIVLDLNMPKISGMEVLKYIRSNSRFSGIPVYIMTTSGDETEKIRCLALGAKAFFTKPHTYSTMLEWAATLKLLPGAV